MSKDKPSTRTLIQRVAVALVRREMAEYDALSRVSRYRVVRSESNDAIDALTQEKLAHHEHGTRSCAHGRALHDVCAECERTDEDCKAYRVAASQRIKDLLKQLGE
jgi:hypothetical protein